MGFIESIKICFRKYATTEGRAIRSEYWYFVIFLIIGGIIFSILDIIFFPDLYDYGSTPLNWIFSLVTLLPYIGVTARRLHDVNRSGWWMLIPFTIISPIKPYLIEYMLLSRSSSK
mgnify:CR=1 FL=1